MPYEDIVHVLPFRDGRDRQPRREHRRDILQAVDREIDAMFEQCLLDLFREESFGSDQRQRRIENGIASGFDNIDFDRDAGAHPPQFVPDEVRLPEGKLASAGANNDWPAAHSPFRLSSPNKWRMTWILSRILSPFSVSGSVFRFTVGV